MGTRFRPVRIAARALAAIGLLSFACLPVLADDQQASEYAIKAAIVYKIAKFVSWPTDAMADDGVLPICLPASDPIGPAMDALAGKTVKGRRIEIHRFESSEALSSDCAILFLSQAAALPRPTLLSDVANSPVLTIGDSAEATPSGRST